MCGIVGFIGNKHNGVKVVLDGLQSLEYRGYDSAGVAYIDAKKSGHIEKQVGRVANVSRALSPALGKKVPLAIGHTRWATHGTPTVKNAHPHFNKEQTVFAVHNGIIENHTLLRSQLEAKGYEFITQTDTEVIPHLIDFHFKQTQDFAKAFEAALSELEGAYAIAAFTTQEPDKLFAARLSSPLVVGIGADGEHYIASDATAIGEHTKQVLYLEDYEMVTLCEDGYTIKHIRDAKEIERKAETITFESEDLGLGDFEHYMLKEMHEVPDAIRSAIRGRIRIEDATVKLGGLESVSSQLAHIERIIIVACGTSYYAGLVGEYLIEELAGIPVEVQLASEFKYRDEPLTRSTAILALSQSGETADTIAALKKVEGHGILRLGVVNAVGSAIARLTDAGVYLHAGPEQAVASTKAFISQVTVMSLIALQLSANRSTKLFQPMLEDLADLPEKAVQILAQAENIRAIAKKYTDAKDFLFIGRRYSYPCALEGALKLKEVSYIHAEGYAAGEMKHGPLAMIDPDFPTFALACDSPLLDKTYSNIQEIRARKGPVIAIATEGNKHIKDLTEDVIYIPKSMEQTQPQLIALAEQLFAYYVATEKGLNVDRPRNLAKSVTVE
ncbi:MAG TPA: glutamine--fructose-6-phosphate transaminase (isomerizing) [Candidatus Saccharimonadales bacterium]|nr:glutamine--fructose-6-phosphate transaminase (isomerizing) [Candidatus Saccharimonadales bacterium]